MKALVVGEEADVGTASLGGLIIQLISSLLLDSLSVFFISKELLFEPDLFFEIWGQEIFKLLNFTCIGLFESQHSPLHDFILQLCFCLARLNLEVSSNVTSEHKLREVDPDLLDLKNDFEMLKGLKHLRVDVLLNE